MYISGQIQEFLNFFKGTYLNSSAGPFTLGISSGSGMKLLD